MQSVSLRVGKFEDRTGDGDGFVFTEGNVLYALLPVAFGDSLPVGDCDALATYVKVGVLHSVPVFLVFLEADLGGDFDTHLFKGDLAKERNTVYRIKAVETTPAKPMKVVMSPVKLRVSGVVICCL